MTEVMQRRVSLSSCRRNLRRNLDGMPEGPPKFIQSLRNCKVAEGTAARFECKIRGNPEPEVEWTREGKVLRESKQLTFLYDDEDNCKLIITKGTSADVGEYKVTAWNHHGRATSTAQLIIDNGLDDDSTASESELSEPEPDDQIIDIQTSKFTKFYTVKEELGKGRFGVVFRCIDNRTGKALAAKIIKCAKEQDKEEVKHEIEIMNTIRPHRRLLTLTDAYATDTEMVIVTELVTGGELFEKVVEDDYIDEAEVSSYMKQILEGVQHMHERDVLHLDLKPENIMLVRPDSKQIKLIDFGLARKYIPGNDLKIMFGTPEFVAPEVLTYDTITPATDLWSVGVIAYVLLSGLSPFMGDTDAETLINVQLAEWDFDDPVFAECSLSVKDFISSLLVLEPEDRATVVECLKQDWLLMKKGKGKKIKTDRLKAFTARRKWKKAMSAIRSTNFLKRLLGSRGSVGDASKPDEGGGGGLLARVKAMHAAGVQAPTGGTPPTSSGFLTPSSAAVPFAGMMAGQAIKEEHFPPKKDLTNEVIVEEKVPAAKGWGRLANKTSEPPRVDSTKKSPKPDAKVDKKAPEPKPKSEPKIVHDKKDEKISSNKPGQLLNNAPEPEEDRIKKAPKPEPKVDKKSPEPKSEPKIGHDKKNEKISSNKPGQLNNKAPEHKADKISPKPEPKVDKKSPEPKPEPKIGHDKKNEKISSNKPGQLANKAPEHKADSIKISPKPEPKFNKKDENPSTIKTDENVNKAGPTQSQQNGGGNTNKAGQFGKKDDKKLDHKHDKATKNDKSANENASEPKSSELKNNEKTSNVSEPNHGQTKTDVKPESKKLEKPAKKEEQHPKQENEHTKDLKGKIDPSTNGPESRNGPVKMEKVPQPTEKEEKAPEIKPQEVKKEAPTVNSASRDDKKDQKGPVSKFGQAKKTPNKLGDKIGKFNQVKSAAPTFGLDYTKRNKPAEKKPPFPRQQGAAPMMEFGMSYNKKPASKENAATTAKAEQKTSNAAERNGNKASPMSASEGKVAADETKTATNRRRRRRRRKKRRVQGVKKLFKPEGLDKRFPGKELPLKLSNPESYYNFSKQDLGRGKWAVVRRAVDKKTKKAYAAKIIKYDSESIEIVLQEFEIHRSLKNDKILGMRDAYICWRYAVFMFDVIEGVDCLSFIGGKPRANEEDICFVLRPLLEVLKFLHGQKVVHLDIRPANIIMTKDYKFKLIDFGCARRLTKEDGEVGGIVGNPEFTAPEMYNYENVHWGADMWSVGVITYMLLSGSLPFTGEDEDAVEKAVADAKWSFDAKAFTNATTEARDFISKLLVKVASKRLDATDALTHAWFSGDNLRKRRSADVNTQKLKDIQQKLKDEEADELVQGSFNLRAFDEDAYESPDSEQEEEE